MPINKMREWLEKEQSLGSPDPNNIVLATSGNDGIPHSRIVAIREITNEGVLFFTQRSTRKARELTENSKVSMTLWLPLQQREVIIDGMAKALSHNENEKYWQENSRERQLRFSVYGQMSAQPISSLSVLEEKYRSLSKKYHDQIIPMNENYCGFCIIPSTFYFYTLGIEMFSEVEKYLLQAGKWQSQLISP